MSRHGPIRVVVEYAAVSRGAGWLPMFWDNGKASLTAHGERLFDRAEALQIARAEAIERSTQYIGDWDIVVQERA